MYGREAGAGVPLVVMTAGDENEQGDVTFRLGVAALVEWLGIVMAVGG